MNPSIRRIILLAACVCAASFSFAEAKVLDPGALLSPETAKMVADRAADFERRTGMRLVVEFRAKSPSEKEDAVPGAFMRALAQSHGTASEGVLAVYFADEPDWRLWIGDALTARFVGQASASSERPANEAIHEVKEALFAAAAKRGANVSANPKSPEYVRAQTIALLDGLAARFRRDSTRE
jgi:hypothetical protein